MKCTSCGTESDGNFCPTCGAPLQPGRCAACGANLVPGAAFCTQCGTAVAGAARTSSRGSGGRTSRLPWYIAGGILLLLGAILLVPMLIDDDGAQTRLTDSIGTPGAPPPLTGTPREQADRLFNRIMAASGAGDSAEARRFAPMAIQAYGMAAPLDDDGLFHLATVHIVAGDYATARAAAERILDREENHLLGLAAAGEAAQLAGDSAAARAYYQRFLAAYDREMMRGLQEYRDHSRILPEYRATALRMSGG